MKKWLIHTLSIEQQEYFEQFLFPIPLFNSSDFPFEKLATEHAQSSRKDETDAIVPFCQKFGRKPIFAGIK